MAAYRLIVGSSDVITTADNALIPADNDNADWRAYQVWLAVPNTPDSALSGGTSPSAAQTAYDDCVAAADFTALKNALVAYFDAIR